jgi:hypothetical protein
MKGGKRRGENLLFFPIKRKPDLFIQLITQNDIIYEKELSVFIHPDTSVRF